MIGTIFTWLNTTTLIFINLVWEITVVTIQIQPLKNDVYTHNFEFKIHGDANQVRQLCKVWHLTK